MTLRNIMFKGLLLFVFIACIAPAVAQTSKKPSRAILQIITYDQDHNVLHTGNAFYISEEGIAITDFDLLRGAYKADAIDYTGAKYPVTRLLGVSELYNMVRIKIAASKETPYLNIASEPVAVNTNLQLVPYSTEKKAKTIPVTVTQVSPMDSLAYYKVQTSDTKEVSLPLINDEGLVVAVTQRSATNKDSSYYAMDARLAEQLQVRLLPTPDDNFTAIHIPKGLPNTQDDADAYIYMMLKGSADSTATYWAIQDFIASYPDSPNGYANAAQYYALHRDYAACDEAIQMAFKRSERKDDIHYIFSKIIYQKVLFAPQTVYQDWDLKKALVEAQEAYRIKPEALYLIQQGDCAYGLKEYDKAADLYLNAAHSNLASADLYLYAAQAKEAAKAPTTEILALMDSALTFFPKPYYSAAAPYLLKRATLLQSVQKHKAAVLDLNEYERLIGRSKLKDNFFVLRYTSELEGKMFQQAVNDLDYLLTRHPNDCSYLAERAYVYLAAGELETAIKLVTEAQQYCADNSTLYKILGIAYGEQGKKTQALAALKRCIDLGDTSAQELLTHYQ